MPAPRKERGLVLNRNRVFQRRVSLPEARNEAGEFRRGTSSNKGKRSGGGRLAGAVVRAKPRSLQAADNASRSTSGPRAPRVSTPRTSKKKGPISRLRKNLNKLRANRARNRAARARARAKKLRGRG